MFRNDDGRLAVSNEDKKIALKNYHEKLMNRSFSWNSNSLSQANKVSDRPCLKNKDIVRESVSKLKNRKAAGPSGVVSKVIKAAGKAAVNIIANLVNQIKIEGVIAAEWELRTIVNFYRGKGDSLEGGNYSVQKSRVEILKIA